jgi:23S rRNA (adenine2503-C2)-methyltransferase
MGIIRNLSPAEILAQVVFSRREAAARGLPSVDNIVFMGMGEPLDNPDGLVQALQALTDPNRFAFSKTKVLVSTVAPSPQSLQVLSTLDCQIAWSLHAPDDALRKALVPSTRHTLQQLRDGMAQILAERARRGALHSLMLEYVLLQDVNDSLLHAQALAAFLEPLHSVTRDSSKPQRSRTGLLVNLIPFNQGTAEAEGLNGFKRPSRPRVRAFQARIYVALAVLALNYLTLGTNISNLL